MVLFRFMKVMLVGELIDVYNYGNYWWDFIYIDDIVEGIIRMLDNIVIGDFNW